MDGQAQGETPEVEYLPIPGVALLLVLVAQVRDDRVLILSRAGGPSP